MKPWKDQVIVVTGASSGTSRTIAATLAKKQPVLVLSARARGSIT